MFKSRGSQSFMVLILSAAILSISFRPLRLLAESSSYADLANEYEFAVVVSPAQETPPGISGDIVVWSKDVGGNIDIFGKNLLTGEDLQICTHPANQTYPAISGNYVVWVDDRNAGDWCDIYGKNLSTGQEIPICTAPGVQQYFAISGDYVIWLHQGSGSGIYGKRLSTGQEFLVTNEGTSYDLAIYGNKVLYRKGYPTFGLYGKDIQTGEEFPICTTNVNSNPSNFAIYDNIVVWEDERNTPNPANIYGADISDIHNVREFSVCVGAWGKAHPDIYNNVVVWQDHRNDYYSADIYAKDLITGNEFPICLASGNQGLPAIFGKNCVWYDQRNAWENSDIYGNKVLPAVVVEEKRFSFDPVGAMASDPVNTLTGNLYHNETDLTIPSPGMSFEFARAYNASDSYNGPLGPGWTHSYNVFLVQDPCDAMHRVKWGDGQGHYYLPDVNIPNSYHPATSALYDKLKKNPDNSWMVIRKDQTRYYFNTSGKLISIVDKNGNIVYLSYDGSNRLSQIRDTVNRIITVSYNASNLVQSVTDPNGRQIIYGYTGGKLTSVTDPNGNAEYYGYDTGNGKLKTITDRKGVVTLTNVFDTYGRVIQQINGRGKTSTFAYNTPGQNKTTITDPKGRQTIHTYDAYLRMVSITDPCGNSDSYAYDNKGNRTSITDKKGNVRRFTYDDKGNVLKTISPPADPNADPNNPNHAMVSVVTYDANNNPLTKTDANGTGLARCWTYQYDANGNLIHTINPDGNESSRSYTIRGLLASQTDENGHITRYTYDVNGNLTDVNDPCGNITHYEYDSIGRMLTKRDARDNTTRYTYDKNNNLLAETDPCNNSTRYAYDKNNNKTSTTDKRNNTWRTEYNENNIVFRETDPCGFETLYEYDDVDNRTTVTDKRGKKTRYNYDPLNRVIDTNDPLGHHTSYTYDEKGNKTSQTNALGKTWTYKYDSLDRLIEEKDPLGNTTRYEYDLLGRKIAFTDAKDYRTRYDYDALDRLIKVTDALGGITEYEYDKVGNLITIINANNKAGEREYDELNRLIAEIDPLGNTTEYQYDRVGNRIARKDAMGRTTIYKYDAQNRLIEINYPDGNNVSYGYDENGNRIAMTDWNGDSAFEFDKLNRMTTSADAYGKMVRYRYDEKGNRKAIVYPDGNSVTYNYDDADRLQSIVDWNARSTTYSYDDAGNLKSVLLPNASMQLYDYDNASRLISVQNKDKDGNSIGGFQYTLDAVGNRIEIQESGTLPPALVSNDISYTYDDSDRLETAGTCTYAFNDNGDQASRDCSGATSNYAYDPKDLLVNVTQTGLNLQHIYDGLGNRIARKQGLIAKRYVLDSASGMSQVLCETNSSGTITAYYIYGAGLVAKITLTGIQRYYHYDGLGSTVALTDGSGSKTDLYAYSPFGELSAIQGLTDNSFKYVGRFGVMTEPDSTLFMRARFYEPTTGRFLSKDPVEGSFSNPLSLHEYVYVMNASITNIDATGTSWFEAQNFLSGFSHVSAGIFSSPIVIAGEVLSIIGDASGDNRISAAGQAVMGYPVKEVATGYLYFANATNRPAPSFCIDQITKYNAALNSTGSPNVEHVIDTGAFLGQLLYRSYKVGSALNDFGNMGGIPAADKALDSLLSGNGSMQDISTLISGGHTAWEMLQWGMTLEKGSSLGHAQQASIQYTSGSTSGSGTVSHSSGTSSQSTAIPRVNVPRVDSVNPQTYSQTYTSTTRKYK